MRRHPWSYMNEFSFLEPVASSNPSSLLSSSRGSVFSSFSLTGSVRVLPKALGHCISLGASSREVTGALENRLEVVEVLRASI
jgi:hypothetical protein